MAFLNSSSIVTDGLLIYFDTQNTGKSYKGAPATNIVTNASAFSGWTNYWRTDYINTFVTEFGTTGYRITGNPSWNGVYRGITLPSTGTYTFSAWFRYWGGTTNNNGSTVYISGYGLSDTAAALNKNLIGVWQRVTLTVTATATSGTLYLISYGGDNTGRLDCSTWDVTMPQVESGSAATPFVDGSRSATQSLIDLSGSKSISITGSPTYNSASITIPNINTAYLEASTPSQFRMGVQSFTLCAWVKQLDNGSNVLLEARADTPNLAGYLWVLNYPSAGQIAVFLNYGGSQYTYTSTISTLSSGSVQNIVAVIDRTNTQILLYVNGVLWNTITGIHTFGISPTGGDMYRIGYDRGGSTQNYELYSYMHYGYALTAAQVAQNFNAQRGKYGL